MKSANQNEVGKLFSSQLLERLTRTHIAVPVILFLIYATALLTWSIYVLSIHWTLSALVYLVGLIAFTWVEYQVHRHIFHIKDSTPAREKFQYTIHGIHHHFPKDKERLAMPPVLSVTIATLLLLLFKTLMGNFAFAFLSGFVTGYAAYLLVHYMIHIFRPPKNFLRVLWIHHSMHHYKDQHRAFGVSSPLWDFIYRTMP